ncbi:hypothetical protein DFQ30_010235 [Apophysomyces sp. BC1015]|nr:hypothetical protein DFQ30_010235 [Apophysomyces sp. BC1015]
MTEEDAKHILKKRIQLLHEYNDLKDTALMMLANYAGRTGATLKDVHAQFGVEDDSK